MLTMAERQTHIEAVRAESWSKYWAEALIVETVRTFRIVGRYTEADYQRLENQLQGIIPAGSQHAYRMTRTIENVIGSASGVYSSGPDLWSSDSEVIHFSNIEYSLLVLGGDGNLISNLRSVFSEVRMPVRPSTQRVENRIKAMRSWQKSGRRTA